MNKKQIVYIPTKVEDELPEMDREVFTLNTMIPGRVMYPPTDDGYNKNINCRVSEIPNNCEKWYDENNFNFLYAKVNSWLKPTEAYVFASEELKQLLEGYTNAILNNTEIKLSKDWIRAEETIRPGELVYPITIKVHNKSILKQLELIKKELDL